MMIRATHKIVDPVTDSLYIIHRDQLNAEGFNRTAGSTKKMVNVLVKSIAEARQFRQGTEEFRSL